MLTLPWRRLSWFGLLTFTLLSGCSFTGKQSALDPKGPVARIQDDLFWTTVWVNCGVFIIVAAALFYVVIKYRERPGDEKKPMPAQGHGNPLIEIGLIAGSVFLLVIIAIPTLKAIWMTHELPVDEPYYEPSKLGMWYGGHLEDSDLKDEILEINVYGWQWWWSFEYPQFGITTANEFAIPAGKVVKLNLRSNDVIHSFWLPKIAGKVDLMPGRKNWMWIMADEPGYYYGQCAEFCGEAHAYMLFRSEVMSDGDFQQWVEKTQSGANAPAGFRAQPNKDMPDPTAKEDWLAWSETIRKNPEALPSSPIHLGAELFMGKAQCIVCHAIDNSPAMGQSAPNLTRIGTRKSLASGILDNTGPDGEIDSEKQLENIYNWIAHSEDHKPGNLMYYREDAGLRKLKYTGVTFSKLQAVGITEQSLVDAGVSSAVAKEIAASPDAPILNVEVNAETMTHKQLETVMDGLTNEQFAEASDWPSQEDFHNIAMFLQTLK